MVFQGEDKASLRLTWQELFDLVSRRQQAMRRRVSGSATASPR